MTIKVNTFVRNLELSERLNDYVEKKISKLDKYLDTLEEARVDLAYAETARSSGDRQVAQITLLGKGVMLRAEERTDDIYASVDAVVEKLMRQIDRYKGKRRRGRGDGKTIVDVLPPQYDPETGELDTTGLIVRRKGFELRPMFEEEAVEQMGLLDHEDFFVFLNAESQQVNIVYRRRNGSLGLIETHVA